ncbi:hypothetical protein HOU02_gp262 [Caulobacter phage CcrBL9]|uniref:Uncharacterized protein n=1 Tax=Caulobacter phage CcrBL9 TaxID=2283270 RepID=A0A385ECG3_9CAUD|nr:hypothetical protein HOU02_gp262 [Caulobacter phage CcrBL9]AXQ69463.1 hypothetical protein CcrBL9_gp439 [Caulobacter phage CcrBL9]
MADHRFNVLTPIVQKVREKTDLKPVRKEPWFKHVERLEAWTREETPYGPASDPMKRGYFSGDIDIAAYLVRHSDVGGKQLRADTWRRLQYLRSYFQCN